MPEVPAHPGLPRDVAELVLAAFARPNFIESYPTTFAHPDRWITLREKESLTGFCALRSFYWSHPSLGLVHGVCLGSVCTHPDHRGRGVGLTLMAKACKAAAALAADFVFLFSDLDHFYRKAGFVPVGNEQLAPLQLSAKMGTPSRTNAEIILTKRKQQRLTTRFSLSKIEARSLPDDVPLAAHLWRFLAEERSSRQSVLGHAEFRALLAIPDMALYVLSDDALQAVCFLGKGADFRDVLHGAAARSPAHLIELLGSIVEKERRRAFLFLLPPEGLGLDLAVATNPLLFWRWLPTARHAEPVLQEALSELSLYPSSLQSI